PDITGGSVPGKETGRIYRIAPTESRAEVFADRYDDLSRMDDVRLAELQRSGSDWHARRARLELQERAAAGRVDPDARRALAALFIDFEQSVALRWRAMWGLHLTGGFEVDVLQRALSGPEEYLRAWTVQLITESGD